MKQKKDFRYHLKKDVRHDLVSLRDRIDFLLKGDSLGYLSIPFYKTLPEFFKVFSHLIWVRSYESWFKKVYD